MTGYSHERLQILHQLAGYGSVFWVVFHATAYLISWRITHHDFHELQESDNVVGIVAGWCVLVIFFTAIVLQRLRYEMFYIIHIVMSMLLLVLVGLHKPDIATKTLVIVIIIATIWAVDRLIRMVKISVFAVRNKVTVTPLPHGGTRIVLRKTPPGAAAGAHCFVWIPGIRKAETHPFTIVSTNPLEFVVSAYDGFTRDLHEYALKNPGKDLRASIDGPYGCVPDLTLFTKVIFIAGMSSPYHVLHFPQALTTSDN